MKLAQGGSAQRHPPDAIVRQLPYAGRRYAFFWPTALTPHEPWSALNCSLKPQLFATRRQFRGGHAFCGRNEFDGLVRIVAI